MNLQNGDKSVRDRRLDEVVTAYLKDIDAGLAPNPAVWLARYPEFADELAAFFAAQHQVDHLAAPLRAPAPIPLTDSPTQGLTPDGTALAAPGLGTVRYFGDYELLEEIARGGMGVVYKARQVTLQRIVAVKMILAGELANQTDVERFHTEARAAANLHHPHIVAIHEVGQHDRQHYFSMDYVAGESLATRIARGPLPARDAATLLMKVAGAVAFAHVDGVIHRDLKPANILLDAKGEPHVTDFGLAKRVHGEPGASATGANAGADLTQTGQVLGTPSYMPPEQAAGKTKEIGPLADVYSLGAVLYCAVTGRPPFQAASTLDTLLQVLDREPVPPRTLNSAVPRDLETICLKCLEKDPRRRYASAQELVDELQCFLDGKPIKARPVTRRERALKWIRRRPAAAALMGVSAAATVGLAALAVALIINERDRGNLLEAQVASARSHVYSSDLALAAQAFEKNNAHALQADLDALRPKPGEPDLRGFEWHYLWRQNNRERLKFPELKLLPIPGESELLKLTDPRRLVFSPDGKLVATRKNVCDLATGRVVLEYDEVPGSQIFFSPDSRFIFNGASIRPLFAAEAALATGIKIPLVPSEPARDAAGNPMQTEPSWPLGFLASNALVVLHPDSAPPGLVVQGKKADRVAAMVKSYNAATGKETMHDFQVRKGYRIVAAAWSEERGLLAVASTTRPLGTSSSSGEKDEVEVWNLIQGGRTLFQFEQLNTQIPWYHGDLKDLLFSPDGGTLAVATRDRTVRLCNPASGKQLVGLDLSTVNLRRLAFSHDSKSLLTLSRAGNPYANELKVWDVAGGKELIHWHEKTPYQGDGRLDPAAIAPDGKTLATARSVGATGLMELWDTATGKLRATLLGHKNPVRDLSFAPDGKTLAALDVNNHTPIAAGNVKLWDAAEEKPIGLPLDTSAVTAMDQSPDGKTVTVGFANGTIRLCEAHSLKVRSELRNQSNPVDMLSFSPDGKQLAASHQGGAKDKNIDVWDMASGKVAASFPGYLKGFDGKVVAAIARSVEPRSFPEPPDTITLWDVATKNPRLEVKDAQRNLLAMTRDGQVAATVKSTFTKEENQPGGGQCRFKIWNVADGKERLTSPGAFQGRGNSPSFLKFSPDGKYFAMGDDNLDVLPAGAKERTFPSAGRLYDMATGKELALFPLARQIRDGVGRPQGTWTLAEFSPDSKVLLTISNDDSFRNKVSLWEMATGKELVALNNPEKLATVCAAMSPDGKTLATVTFGKWVREPYRDGKKVTDGTEIRMERSSPDGSGSGGGTGGLYSMDPVYEMHVWDVRSAGQAGKPDLQLRKRFIVSWQSSVEAIAFSGDGQTIYTRASLTQSISAAVPYLDKVQAWDAATGKEKGSVGDHGTRFHALAYAPDGRLLAATDQRLNEHRPAQYPTDYQLRTWDVARKQELAAPQTFTATELPLDLDAKSLKLASNTPPKHDAWEDVFSFGSHSSIATSPDGKVKAVRAFRYPIHSAGPDGKTKIDPIPTDVTLVDAASGEVRHVLKGHGQWVCRLAFTPDGKTLAVGEYGGAIKLWNVAAGRLLLTIPAHTGPVTGLAFRADGRALASCSDSEIRLWQAATDE